MLDRIDVDVHRRDKQTYFGADDYLPSYFATTLAELRNWNFTADFDAFYAQVVRPRGTAFTQPGT